MSLTSRHTLNHLDASHLSSHLSSHHTNTAGSIHPLLTWLRWLEHDMALAAGGILFRTRTLRIASYPRCDSLPSCNPTAFPQRAVGRCADVQLLHSPSLAPIMSSLAFPLTSTTVLPLRSLDVDLASPSSPGGDLPHDSSEPAFHEHLSSSLSPRTSPVSAPILPPLQPGTALLTALGRPFLFALAHRHRPVVFLHRDEPCMPCTPDWFTRHADLHHGDTVVATAEELSGELLGNESWLEERRLKAIVQQQQQLMSASPPLLTQDGTSAPRRPRQSKAVRHQQYNLRVRPAHRGGEPPATLSVTVPMLCYVRDTPSHYELVYTFCYAYNAPYRVLALMWLGAHDGDWEHITVRVNKATDRISHIYYGAHGWRDGVWKAAGEFETDQSRPVVYIAKGSHACYPHAGRWLRIWAGANDLCERGWRWDADKTLLLHLSASGRDEEDREVGWLRYSGWWEYEGISSPPQQQWWYREPVTSNTVLRRCFTSFVRPFFGMQPELWLLKRELELEATTDDEKT